MLPEDKDRVIQSNLSLYDIKIVDDLTNIRHRISKVRDGSVVTRAIDLGNTISFDKVWHRRFLHKVSVMKSLETFMQSSPFSQAVSRRLL